MPRRAIGRSGGPSREVAYSYIAPKLCRTVRVQACQKLKGTNITIRVDAELARDVKVIAAQRQTSLSRLVAEHLRTLVQQDGAYAAARQRALVRLKEGYDLGWRRPLSRTEVHDRESLR